MLFKLNPLIIFLLTISFAQSSNLFSECEDLDSYPKIEKKITTCVAICGGVTADTCNNACFKKICPCPEITMSCYLIGGSVTPYPIKSSWSSKYNKCTNNYAIKRAEIKCRKSGGTLRE